VFSASILASPFYNLYNFLARFWRFTFFVNDVCSCESRDRTDYSCSGEFLHFVSLWLI